MTRSILLIFIFLGFGLSLSAQSILRGTVLDDNDQPLAFASVSYEIGGAISGATTDLDGNYSIQLDPGSYTVTFSYTGYHSRKFTEVIVKSGGVTKVDAVLSEGVQIAEAIVIGERYEAPLIEKDGKDGQTFTNEQIENLPGKDIGSIVSTVPGVNVIDNGSDDYNMKGGRSNSTVFYLDDVRIRGTLPPSNEIEQLEVMTGGIEAKYGDTGGGIISVISKGPSRNYSGNVEVETSQYLDQFGYNLASANFSGPIISKMKDDIKRTVLGFRLSGQYRIRKDDSPPILPVYVASDKSQAESSANPVIFLNQTSISRGETYSTVGDEGDAGVDVWKLKYNPDETEKTLDVTAKFDARVTDDLQLTLTGTFYDRKDRFTPFGWQFMNSKNNPTFRDQRTRGIFRIRHRLGNWNGSAEDKGLIQNFAYTLIGSYEKRDYGREDKNFGDRLFEYGHAGYIAREFTPMMGIRNDTFPGAYPIALPNGDVIYVFNSGWADNFAGYESSDFNLGLAAYNDPESIESETDLRRYNGVAKDITDDIWGQLKLGSSPLYKNANQVYNRYEYGEQNLASVQANLSFDLNPKSKTAKSGKKKQKGVHSINLGFQYEQRSDKKYLIRPQDLWNIAANLANNELQAVDSSRIIGYVDTTFNGLPVHFAKYDPILTPGYSKGAGDKNFYGAIRGWDEDLLHQYISFGDISPNDLSLDMFSGSELIGHHEQGLRTLDYYGYDYLGNPVDKGTSFNDFFTSKDANGNRNYPVAPSSPIYLGGYIQDKFIYDDMIFKIGVRVDRYDANTKVLRDKLSMYPIMGASLFHNEIGTAKPDNIGDEYKVYTKSPTSSAVVAYRNDEQWYFADGSEAPDGNVIFGGGLVSPAYEDGKPVVISSKDFKPDRSFRDFEPQIDISPRLSFSFPISDDANFFAHYDILSQRPTSNTVMTPLDYYNFFNDGGALNNPDLKTQKAIDYAVGFQQKVSNSSSVKLTAFYQEMRDLIQRRILNYVPIVQEYTTYDNIDFSTTKGFTFEYDLRRTKNTSLYLTYSLQFVNGTGSGANSTQGLATRGVIRTTSPLSYDQRHTIQMLLDYRYKKQEGPRLFGKYIFENAGANLLLNTYSGRPFTAKDQPTMYNGSVTIGSLNGARMPWSYSVGMRVDKDFTLTKETAKHPVFMNVYFRAVNLLNTKNLVYVYPATGSAYDDGYLATDLGQDVVGEVRGAGQDVNSFLNYYKWGLEDPTNFVLPRRFFVGVIFDF